MRRTSSLGRRSSTQNMISGRPNMACDSGNRDDVGKRKSKLLQPGFSRAKSIDKMNSVSKELGSMRRSNSHSNLFESSKKVTQSAKKSMAYSSAMTPVTPGYKLHANLPTGMSRPKRSQTLSTESARMSSIGGTKIMRKDTRPLTEKAYMNQAIDRIQTFFRSIPEGQMLFGDKVSLVPLSTSLFIEIVSVLIKLLGVRTIITKSNYVEEMPTLMKKLGYRGKVERSWLITVSAPHSSYYAIGLIEWLVTLSDCMTIVEIDSMMYVEDIDMSKEDDDEEDDARNFKILTPHLKWGYDQICTNGYDEEAFQKRDEILLKELLEDANLGDIEQLEAKCKELENEFHNPAGGDEDVHEIQDLKQRTTQLKNYLESLTEFITKSKLHIERTKNCVAELTEQEDTLKKACEYRKNELENLRSKVSSQKIQLSDIKKMDSKRLSIERHMNHDMELFREFENHLFKEDILLVSTRKKLDNELLKYNKEITTNRAFEPRLKNAEMDGKVLSIDAKDNISIVDNTLKELKLEYKSEKENVDTKEEQTMRTINQLQEELSMITDDIERMTSEKMSLEQDLNQITKGIQMKRKEIKDKCAKLKCSKNELMTVIGQQTVKDDVEKEKSKLKDIEHDMILIKNRYEQLFETVKNAFNSPSLQEKEDMLNEKYKSIFKK